MSKKDKPLPKPPSTPFGRKRHPEEGDAGTPLLADQLAAAAAEGRLDEYLEQEMPGNEYARSLTKMMLGMTGMLPAEIGKGDYAGHAAEDGDSPPGHSVSHPAAPPEDLLRAVQSGDAKAVSGILERELKKRATGEAPDGDSPPASEGDSPSGPAVMEKEVLNGMIKIASENDVSLDWLVVRALKVYIEEYKKSGRL